MASSRPATPSPGRLRQRRLLLATLACGLLAVAIGGCAEVPPSGKPQALEDNSGQPAGFVQPLPPPGPTTWWSADDVIEGFLHASASLALDSSAAQPWLAPGVHWDPLSGNTVVIVVGALSQPALVGPPVGHLPTGATKQLSYDVTGPRMATLTPSGQYINSPGAMGTFQFTLAQYKHIYRIQSIQQTWPKSAVPTASLLLLDQADFQQVFQPRNLYFFSQPTTNQVPDLVPDPVFAPIQGSTVDLARRLITDLISGAGNAETESWLSAATATAFPAGTRLLGVTISSNLTATVNLAGTAATVPQDAQQQMYEQLNQTLTSAPAVAASVQLEFNGLPFQSSSPSAAAPPSAVPRVGTTREPLYFVGQGSDIVYMRAPGRAPVEVAGPSQFSASQGITAVAATRPDQGAAQVAVATPSGQGCLIATGTAFTSRRYRTYLLSSHGGPCTALSWDGNGDLWAAAGARIWVVRPGQQQPLQVSLPNGISGHSPTVVALRVAPDSTRVALLVHTASGNGLYLAAVSYATARGGGVSFGPPDPIQPIGPGGASQLSDPTALTWYSPNSLAVIDGPSNGADLYLVPLSGGQAQPIGSVPDGTNAISSNGMSIMLGTEAERILNLSTQSGSYHDTSHGEWPTYPG